MTKTEVDQLITDTLHKTLGHHAHLFNLQESSQQRQVREAGEERHLKEAKAVRKESKRLQESGREAFRSLGLSKREAKFAAQGRPEFRG